MDCGSTKIARSFGLWVNKKNALRKVYTIALRTIAESAEQGKVPVPISWLFGYEMARR